MEVGLRLADAVREPVEEGDPVLEGVGSAVCVADDEAPADTVPDAVGVLDGVPEGVGETELEGVGDGDGAVGANATATNATLVVEPGTAMNCAPTPPCVASYASAAEQ